MTNFIFLVGNDLLTKERFCRLQKVTQNLVEVVCLLISSSEWKTLKIPDGLLAFTRRLVDSVPESNCQLPITLGRFSNSPRSLIGSEALDQFENL